LNRGSRDPIRYVEKTFFYKRLSPERHWDDFANRYETAWRLDIVFNQLTVPSELDGKSFLDAGSGGGHFSERASKRGAKVISLDVGTNLLNQVRQRSSSGKVAASVLALPFRNAVFDVVLCTEVIEHTPHPLSAVRELSHLVRPGGLLIITTPSRLWYPLVKLATALRLRSYEGHENFLWPNEIENELKSQGFRIEILIGFNFYPVFTVKIDRLFRFFDRAYGKRYPWAMVNFAARARKRTT
jgi:2-polyprenyl-3-methyl-5-hydroxy-6-metoxy-1,4-benzoquinol methylase